VKDDERSEKRLVDEKQAERPERPRKQPRLEMDDRQESERRNSDTGGGNGGDGMRNKHPSRKVVCHHCGKPGHICPACPDGDDGQSSRLPFVTTARRKGTKIADCPKPRKECNRWPNCPNANCPYFHPPPGDLATDHRSRARSPSRGRATSSSSHPFQRTLA
jgi:hypothetical protein